jgi:hypothetical protein
MRKWIQSSTWNETTQDDLAQSSYSRRKTLNMILYQNVGFLKILRLGRHWKLILNIVKLSLKLKYEKKRIYI